MKKIVIQSNLVTIILVALTIVSSTIAIYSLINQKNLNNIIKMQDAKISELIKYKKDFQFGQTINNDNSITSIEELKKMIKDLQDKPTPNYSDVLGLQTTEPAIILSDTMPVLTPTP